MTPVRIRLSRARGFDLQAHSLAINGLPAVNCARPSRFGNPFSVRETARELDITANAARHDVVKWFREWITQPTSDDVMHPSGLGGYLRAHTRIREGLADLRGKNLACFCDFDGPCHCDVLLDLANQPDPA